MFRLAFPLTLLAVWLSFAPTAEALSCQRSLVVRGDSQLSVERLCGQPDVQRRQVLQRWVSTTVNTDQHGNQTTHNVAVSVLIERWVYDFGPGRLLQELTFEDGVLIRLSAGGRGTSRGQSAVIRTSRSRRIAAR